MTPPLVSIIIPCFNAGRWLGQALESALAQTWPNTEVIVVDDGSTDDSLVVARSFESRGARVINQPNAGQCAACNHGLRLSRGDFIKFFDADDLLSRRTIEIQVQALQQRPGAIAYGEWARFRDQPEEASFERRTGWHDATPVDWLAEIWADGQPMMQCAQFLLPRRVLERVGGWDERLSLINDFEFFARLTLASTGIVFTPGARLYYRSGLPGSLSGRRSVQAWESAALSLTLGTDYLLAAENSPRTRASSAAILQMLVYAMYPNARDTVQRLESRVADLGGCPLRPLGGRAFGWVARVFGWKAARRLQIAAGKHPRPTT